MPQLLPPGEIDSAYLFIMNLRFHKVPVRELFCMLLCMSFLTLQAQHQELNEQPSLWRKKTAESDSTSLLAAFRKGEAHGHFRYFFMATRNEKALSNYHANAAGGGLKFETARFRNFQMGISGFFTFNIGSSDLSKPDPATGAFNRYEIGLFDIQDPRNKTDINRLEELYLKYHFPSTVITFGKQLLNNPFINLQDGRMRTTAVEGVWVQSKPGSKLSVEGGYLYKISPRSTVNWFRVDQSIGVYPSGVNPDGTPSGYAGRLNSAGILSTGIQYKTKSGFRISLWNQAALNLFNTALVQGEWDFFQKKQRGWVSGIQVVRQDALHNGGNADPRFTYFPKGTSSWVFSGKLGWRSPHWESSINYTRITKTGRYLMPREWGREPFYTFMPRERNEGLGDVHAVVGRLQYSTSPRQWKAAVSAGYFDLPDVRDYRLNKYGMPSYYQLNTEFRYFFKGWWKGLEAQLLYVYKGNTGETYKVAKYRINKTNMSQWNLVFNYGF